MTEEPIRLTADRLLSELVAVTNRLSELIEQETARLKAPGLPKLDDIVPEKLKLTARYDALMQIMRQQPGIDLRNEPAAPDLAISVRRLGTLAQVNAQAVDIHLKATRRVLDLVARAARRATTANFTYGKERLGYGARSERHPSITVNRVL
ncbi:MAG: hypothetical protein QOJ54_3448 [Aliidongia sp.]|jgi:hypothetical protein|nr:hypothetical protein [Aliidongia sp.]